MALHFITVIMIILLLSAGYSLAKGIVQKRYIIVGALFNSAIILIALIATLITLATMIAAGAIIYYYGIYQFIY